MSCVHMYHLFNPQKISGMRTDEEEEAEFSLVLQTSSSRLLCASHIFISLPSGKVFFVFIRTSIVY